MTFGEKLKEIRTSKRMSQQDFATLLGTSKQVISRYELGQTTPKISIAASWCQVLNISLDSMLNDDLPIAEAQTSAFPPPIITENYVTFPVIGDIAAGYDSIAIEDWEGDVIEIPQSQLKGRDQSEFFVLRVKGDSMYPTYHDGDKVLILKQTTLGFSGQVGAVLYDDDNATLKKVEFVPGEDWLRLVPINANYPPKRIEGEELDHCRVIGVPRLLIREIED